MPITPQDYIITTISFESVIAGIVAIVNRSGKICRKRPFQIRNTITEEPCTCRITAKQVVSFITSNDFICALPAKDLYVIIYKAWKILANFYFIKPIATPNSSNF
ncbi:hypothetical protein BWR17_19480 (plasmid) [Phaeobacter inhibens]|nr:hypothetical protein BWR17_19480 [Phaeobacter inhibens]